MRRESRRQNARVNRSSAAAAWCSVQPRALAALFNDRERFRAMRLARRSRRRVRRARPHRTSRRMARADTRTRVRHCARGHHRRTSRRPCRAEGRCSRWVRQRTYPCCTSHRWDSFRRLLRSHRYRTLWQSSSVYSWVRRGRRCRFHPWHRSRKGRRNRQDRTACRRRSVCSLSRRRDRSIVQRTSSPGRSVNNQRSTTTRSLLLPRGGPREPPASPDRTLARFPRPARPHSDPCRLRTVRPRCRSLPAGKSRRSHRNRRLRTLGPRSFVRKCQPNVRERPSSPTMDTQTRGAGR